MDERTSGRPAPETTGKATPETTGRPASETTGRPASREDAHAAMRLLREEVGNLVKTVPGPVAAISLRLGECALEVTWAFPQPAAPPPSAPSPPWPVTVAATEQAVGERTATGQTAAWQTATGQTAAWQTATGQAARPAETAPLGAAREHSSSHAVTAPLVGTFYVAAEPGAPPFVQPGDRVDAGQTIGIVEAMKLMNPVVAGQAGEVVEVVAGDGEPVEYGQVLVRIRTDDA